jgi:integrase
MIGEMRDLLTRLSSERSTEDPSQPVLKVKEAQGFITSACRKLGIPRFTTHALHHLFGTACLESGVDVRTVAAWLGHKDNGALLLKIYSHVRRQHETEMVQKVRFAPAPAA